MRTSAYFVTPDDFKNYWGMDLNVVLRGNGAELDSNRASMFLMRIEDELKAWIDANTFRTYRWEDLTGHMYDAMQKAILVQAMYEFRNGNIGMDSGYDPQRGIIAPKKDLQVIVICDPAINILKTSALYSRKVKNRRRWIRLSY